jgi:hypothetical protein
MLSQSLTLVVLLPDRLVRADFASSRAAEPSQFAMRERPEIDDQASLVEIALSLVSKRPGRTFVLSSEVWTHTLALSLVNLRNTTPDEVRQMLAFDAEPISNLSAFEAATGMLPLGDAAGTRTFWVTQVNSAVRDQIVDAVHAAGGKFAGMAHTAGVPQPFGPGSAGGEITAGATGSTADFRGGRIEYWPGVTARIAIRDGKIAAAKVDDTGVGADREAAAEAWRSEAALAGVETLEARGPRAFAAADTLDLADERVLRAWLAAWNRSLRARSAETPIVTAPARPMTQRQQGMIAAALGLAVLGACYGHHTWASSKIDQATAEQTRIDAPRKEVESIRQQAASVDKELTKIREETAKAKREIDLAAELFASHRRRLPELMRLLAADVRSSQAWVLNEISGSGREMKLVGSTTHPEHISRLASDLSIDLEPLGWGVELPKQDARNALDNGAPWKFELKLVDAKRTEGETTFKRSKRPPLRSPPLPPNSKPTPKPPQDRIAVGAPVESRGFVVIQDWTGGVDSLAVRHSTGVQGPPVAREPQVAGETSGGQSPLVAQDPPVAPDPLAGQSVSTVILRTR